MNVATAEAPLALDRAFGEILRGHLARPYLEQDGQWTSLNEVATLADSLFAAFEANGVPQGAAVGLVARNRPAQVAALFGLLSHGRAIVMLHAYQAREKLAEEVRGLGLAVVIADQSDWSPELEQAVRDAGSLGLSVAIGAGVSVRVENAPRADAPELPRTAIAMLTSGTTGAPKRVPISYATLTAAVSDALLATVQAGTSDIETPYIQFYPLGNISGLFGLITCAVRGQPIVLLEKFAVDAWVRAVEAYRPSAFMSLPPAALRMVLDAEVPREALSSIPVLRCGSAPLDPALQRDFTERYGIPILINYGATEFCGVIANWTLDEYQRFGEAKRGSVGRARPGIRLRAVDPVSGAEKPIGETGQLEVLAERIASDWVRTTDLAAIDEDGFLFLKGRADSVIIRGGFKISPEAIAEVLRGHPAVLDAGVIGLPDARLGEVPVAAVELREPGSEPAPAELIALVREQLSPQAAPVRIVYLDQLPRTRSLKVDRGALREMLEQP